MFKIAPHTAFLIAITRREQVATIERSPIYCISDISIIPLASQAEASAVLKRARLQQEPERRDSGDYSDDDASAVGDDDIRDDASVRSVESAPGSKPQPVKSGDSPGEDVIRKKGVYGRFAEKWFSKRGWAVDSQRTLGLSSSASIRSVTPEPPKQPEEPPELEPPKDEATSADAKDVAALAASGETVEKVVEETKETVAHSLTPKLLISTRLLLASSRSFFFSYDFDITRSLSNRSVFGSHTDLPLCKRVDPLVSTCFS